MAAADGDVIGKSHVMTGKPRFGFWLRPELTTCPEEVMDQDHFRWKSVIVDADYY